jgi:cytoplasmic iron level regulating protein YaaA (DUF328/UPF0246 family)
MLILLSPAKTLDMTPVDTPATQPRLLDDTEQLLRVLRPLSASELSELMSVSDKLAELNVHRYQQLSPPFTPDNAAPALLAFRGDVYQGLGATDFSERELDFAQRHIRILSGLYGILRPRDLMQAYRLEMGTRLSTDRGKNLYEFWGDRLTDLLNEDLREEGSGLILNLASQEYFRSLRADRLEGRLLTVHFRELRRGKFRVITFNAKRARGMMARLITLEGITQAEPLKDLVVNDYRYDPGQSSPGEWVFAK